MNRFYAPILFLCAACSAVPFGANKSNSPARGATPNACCTPGCCDNDPNCCDPSCCASAKAAPASVAANECCPGAGSCCAAEPSAR
jgi:hypothetical protein